MLINTGTKPLSAVDCRDLTARVLALPEEAWFEDPRRQQAYDVHAQTQSLILSFCTGWPKVQVTRTQHWETLAGVAVPIVDEIIRKHYAAGGVVLRMMMARLPPGCRIQRHRDTHASFAVAHRIHIPLVTNPQVEFIVGSQRVPVREHFAFELNNLLPHQVTNNGSTARIHFIFDYAPGG